MTTHTCSSVPVLLLREMLLLCGLCELRAILRIAEAGLLVPDGAVKSDMWFPQLPQICKVLLGGQ